MAQKPTTRPLVYLNHGEAYGNLGDEAMLLNAVRRIREQLGRCSFVLPQRPGRPLPELPDCRTVPVSQRSLFPRMDALGLERWLRRLPFDAPWRWRAARLDRGAGHAERLLQGLEECDALYCVGAANMNEWTRRGQLLTKWLLVRWARRLGLPAVVSSQAVGPFESEWALRTAAETAAAAAHFSFRDCGVSRAVLEAAGLPTEGLPDVGDEAFSLPPDDTERAGDILREAGVAPGEPFGLLHFRGTDYVRRTDRHLPKLAAALEEGTSLPWAFLPMSRGYHSSDDRLCAEALRGCMRERERLHVLARPQEPGVARRLVGLSRMVVALSYHLGVFAMAEGVPVLPLVSGPYYRYKARGLASWTAGRLACADLDRMEAVEVAGLMRRLRESRDEQIAVLERAAGEIRGVNDLPVDALRRAVETEQPELKER